MCTSKSVKNLMQSGGAGGGDGEGKWVGWVGLGVSLSGVNRGSNHGDKMKSRAKPRLASSYGV